MQAMIDLQVLLTPDSRFRSLFDDLLLATHDSLFVGDSLPTFHSLL